MPDEPVFWVLVAVIAAAACGAVMMRPRSPFDAVRVVARAALAFGSSRNGVVAAMALAPSFGRWYGPAAGRLRPATRRTTAILACAVSAAVLGWRVRDDRALRFTVDHQQQPVAAVNFIKSRGLAGPMFNDYNFGGWLLWQAWPDHPVFIDGRTEVYLGRVLDEYLAVSAAQPGYAAILDRYGIAFAIVRPEREIARRLLEDPGWGLLYFDYHSAIFARAGLFPAVRRLQVVSPYGNRDPRRVDDAIAEMRYLLDANPLFFGGYKVLASLLNRKGDLAGARLALRRYLELNPRGAEVAETRSLVDALRRRNAWP